MHIEIQLFNTPVQTKNARERLAATFVEGQAMSEGFGGEATMQDLLRLVLCAHIACDRDVKRSSNIVSEEDAQVGLCFRQRSNIGVTDAMRYISKTTRSSHLNYSLYEGSATQRQAPYSKLDLQQPYVQALTPGFLKTVSALLPDIATALRADPDPAALERAGLPA